MRYFCSNERDISVATNEIFLQQRMRYFCSKCSVPLLFPDQPRSEGERKKACPKELT